MQQRAAVHARPVVAGQARPGALLRLPRVLTAESPLPWLFPMLALVTAFGLYPLAYSVWLSLHRQNIYTRSLEYVGFQGWAEVLNDGRMWAAMGTTLIYVGASLAVQLVLGLGIALLLDCDRRGYGVLRALVTLPLVVPPAVAGLMFLLMLDGQYGVLAQGLHAAGLLSPATPILGTPGLALAGLILVDVWQWTPFMVLIFVAGLRALPAEPFEAAAIDGAGPIAAFRHLTLPMLGKVIALAVLIRGIDLFRVYDYVYVMTSGGPGTATETLSWYAGRLFGLANFPAAAILSLITLLVVNAAAAAFFRAARVRL
ncbi:MAG TPA: sugar ABC transporter permease [Crenalkalicoccus sp.]|nr:sugar ABC transporter permease [Crenalkalicoccus sp.]